MSSENSRTILFLLEDPSLFFNVNELAKQNRITYYFSWLSDTPSAIDAISSTGCEAIVVHAKYIDFFRQLRLISHWHVSIIVIYDNFSETIDFYSKECRADACVKIDNNPDFPNLLLEIILSAIEIARITEYLQDLAYSSDRKFLSDSNQKYNKNWIKHDVEKNQYLKKVYSELKKTFYEPSAIDPEQSDNKLIFKMRLPASHLSAGTSLINYIGTLMYHKFNTPSKVTVEQEGLDIKLIIDIQEGMKEKVEQLIHDYILFVRGELPAENILNDPSQIKNLQDQSMIAQMQLQFKQEHLSITEDNLNILQKQVIELTGILSNSFRQNLAQEKAVEHRPISISFYKYNKIRDINKNNLGSDVLSEKVINGDNVEVTGGNIGTIHTGNKQYNKSTIDNELLIDLKGILKYLNLLIDSADIPAGTKGELIEDVDELINQMNSDKINKGQILKRLSGTKDVLSNLNSVGKEVSTMFGLVKKAIDLVSNYINL